MFYDLIWIGTQPIIDGNHSHNTNTRNNEEVFEEVLKKGGDYLVLGDGSRTAKRLIGPEQTLAKDAAITVLRRVIEDGSVASVGGAIQLGDFNGQIFSCYGVREGCEAWRAGLKLNKLINGPQLVPGFPFEDI